MIPGSTIFLHAGAGQELTFLEYLYRVLLSLVAFGGLALLVYSLLAAIRA